MTVLFQLANTLLDLIVIAIIVRAILSWFYPVGRDRWTRLLVDITEPLLAPVRSVLMRILPMPLDLSPIVVFFMIMFLQGLLQSAYYNAR